MDVRADLIALFASHIAELERVGVLGEELDPLSPEITPQNQRTERPFYRYGFDAGPRRTMEAFVRHLFEPFVRLIAMLLDQAVLARELQVLADHFDDQFLEGGLRRPPQLLARLGWIAKQ